MSHLVRMNPETPCQSDGAHHPHRWVCVDPECGCEDDYDDGQGFGPYRPLDCCVCGQEWPCATKRQHVAERKAARQV